ncbi:MAG: PPC domain-containing protein [Thermoproteota archaeon]|nr:PPC domain-containing protein [Thermoproteota archaeon]
MRKVEWNRKTISVVLLAVVLSISLLIGFQLTNTGMNPELETVTVEAVRWQIDRPSDDVHFNERIEKASTNDWASVGIGVEICTYHEDESNYPYEHRDGVGLNVDFNATVLPGFTASTTVRFRPDEKASTYASSTYMVKHNLTVKRMKRFGTNTSEAYILATATNSSCSLKTRSDWVFMDQDLEEHQLKVVFEFTYRNATVHRKIILPIILNMVQDVGETFDAAKNMTVGEHRGCLDGVDYIDMYAINVQNGETINLTMTPPEDVNYDLYLYNPDRQEVANSTQNGNAAESITYQANQTGTWYVRVKLTERMGYPNKGIYDLNLQVRAP